MHIKLANRKTLLKTFFLSFSVLFLVAGISFGLAIAFYPGGNFKDRDHEGFSFLWNALCDLGGDNSIGGDYNRVSQSLYRTGILIVSISGILFFSIIWIFFQERKKSKILSIIGSVMGVLQGGIYIGIGYTHGDLHLGLLTAGPLIEFFAVLFLAIVFFSDKRVPKISSYTFITMFSLAIFYMLFVIVGLIVNGDFEYLVRRAGHTIFNFLILTGYIIQGVGLYLFVRNLDQIPQSEDIDKISLEKL
jgi:hypothetical protein